jgi:hypothetical protein
MCAGKKGEAMVYIVAFQQNETDARGPMGLWLQEFARFLRATECRSWVKTSTLDPPDYQVM